MSTWYDTKEVLPSNHEEVEFKLIKAQATPMLGKYAYDHFITQRLDSEIYYYKSVVETWRRV